MKKQLLLLTTFFTFFICFSQNSFVNGYFINNSNEKVECLILKNNSKNTPTEFEYKLTANSSSEILTIASVKEFGINNASKYIRYSVDIDKSSDTNFNLSYERNPSFTNETYFFEVLVEGKASLFLYKSNALTRYFYNTENSPIKQLIHKKYKDTYGILKFNNDYKAQLWTDLKCADITESHAKNLTYKKTDLINFFIKYNKCENSEFKKFENKEKLILFNLILRPGINSSSLVTHLWDKDYYDVDYGNKLSFRFGIEAEFLIKSRNRNNWAIICEPTYQYYKSKVEVQRTSRDFINEANYKSIEIPLGIRHYFFTANNSKIFVNGAVIFDFPINSKITSNFEGDFDFKSSNNFAFGMGYKFVNKYSFELRYMTSRNTLFNYIYRDSDYKTISAIIGFTIL